MKYSTLHYSGVRGWIHIFRLEGGIHEGGVQRANTAALSRWVFPFFGLLRGRCLLGSYWRVWTEKMKCRRLLFLLQISYLLIWPTETCTLRNILRDNLPKAHFCFTSICLKFTAARMVLNPGMVITDEERIGQYLFFSLLFLGFGVLGPSTNFGPGALGTVILGEPGGGSV